MKHRSIIESTQGFERWLIEQMELLGSRIVKGDLKKKHLDMAVDPFVHLRATCYRYVELFPELCPELMNAPIVNAVVDLHLENYGVWRDEEGRLIWGINDFDEAYPFPYTIDLVRLATSAKLAIRIHNLNIKIGESCEAILEGYIDGLKQGIKPFVLAEQNEELRKMARKILKDPRRFWQKLESQVNRRARVPENVQEILARHLPQGTIDIDYGSRVAGEGSLGRQRFVALGEWNGGRIAREAKIALPSCCVWAKVGGLTTAKHVGTTIRESQRTHSGDPKAGIDGDWVVRRLAPDCARIEFADLPRKNEAVLLNAMGREIANKHLGTPDCRSAILADLRQRPTGWLSAAVKTMTTECVDPDFVEWRQYMKSQK